MLVFALLAACGFPTPDADTADTDPAVPAPCTAIVGSGSIAVVSRADVTALVTAAGPPIGEEAATALAGPDVSGRYYLVEPTGVVKRSDDGGCSWASVGALPGEEADTADTARGPEYVAYDLFTAPTTDRVLRLPARAPPGQRGRRGLDGARGPAAADADRAGGRSG